MDWTNFNPFDALNSVINTGADAYAKVITADALAHPQVGTQGQPYVQGQFSGGVSPGFLLLAGGLLLVLFLEK